MSVNEGPLDAVQGPPEEFDPLSEMLSEMLGSEVEVELETATDDPDSAVVVDLPEPVETFEPVEVAVAADAASETAVEEPVGPESPAVDDAVIVVAPAPMEELLEELPAEPESPIDFEDEPVVVYVEEQPAEVMAADQPEEAPVVAPDLAPPSEPEISDVFAQPETSLDTTEAPGLDAVVDEIDRETALAPQEDFDFGAHSREAERAPRESCIVFLLDGTGYAIPIRNVLELDAMPRITVVPNVPGFVRGITNLRGEIVAVLDLRTLLGMQRTDASQRGRILIVRTADQLSAALAVDDVRGAASLALGELVQPASPIQGKVARVLMGVGEHQNQVLNVLDVDKLFRTPEIQQFAAN